MMMMRAHLVVHHWCCNCPLHYLLVGEQIEGVVVAAVVVAVGGTVRVCIVEVRGELVVVVVFVVAGG